MVADLALSLKLAQKILGVKKTELAILTTVLQETPTLTDELITFLAELWNFGQRDVNALEKEITSLQEQKRIFGNQGVLPKELDIVPKNDYPKSQQP